MPCYPLHDKSGKVTGHICGDLGPPCAVCGGVTGYQCDYPVGEGKACDRHLCNRHAAEVAPEIHYCPGHLQQWKAFKEAGGVKAELDNVTPYAKGYWVYTAKDKGER